MNGPIAISPDLGFAGTVVLMAPEALDIALSNEVTCPTSPADQFVDASGVAALLLSSLKSFGVETDRLEKALVFPEAVSPLEDEHWLWKNRLANLAEQLAQIPKGPFHQAVYETCSAFQLKTIDVDAVRQGAAMVFGKIGSTSVQPVDTQSIPFKAEINPSNLLPELVTRGGLRLFAHLEDLIAFFQMLYGETQIIGGTGFDSGVRYQNWDGRTRSIHMTQFIGRGVHVAETETEKDELMARERKGLQALPPYTYVSVEYYPRGVGNYAVGEPQRCSYVVYLFDASGYFQSVRISAVTRTTGRSFAGGQFRNMRTADRRDLQIFPELN